MGAEAAAGLAEPTLIGVEEDGSGAVALALIGLVIIGVAPTGVEDGAGVFAGGSEACPISSKLTA